MGEQDGSASDVRVCLDCGFAGSTTECPKHPGEPLFDPSDPDVIADMDARDSQRRDRITYTWTAAGLISGLLVGYAVIFVLGLKFQSFGEHPAWREIAGVFCVAAAPFALLGRAIGKRRFRPMFARWVKDWSGEVDPADLAAVEAGKGYGLDKL
ncbi:MAG: hypothetical protein IT384_02655 [Deltaproteobacteria bacterium]|nr:hypothetical protein [Deltaproteobacteria bacterium]